MNPILFSIPGCGLGFAVIFGHRYLLIGAQSLKLTRLKFGINCVRKKVSEENFKRCLSIEMFKRIAITFFHQQGLIGNDMYINWLNSEQSQITVFKSNKMKVKMSTL